MADPPRARRWPWFLAAFAVLLGLGAWWVGRQLEPHRLTALVLENAGDALDLELTIEGTPEYALRPEPRLVLPNLVARQRGAAVPLLRAARAEFSLPWDTLQGSESVVITRIELQRPVLDLAALAAWRATRPEVPFRMPTLTEGLRLTDGSLLGDGWAVTALALDLPGLRPDTPARARLSGRFEQAATVLEFDASLALATASLVSGLGIQASGRLRSGDIDVPYALDIQGHLDAAGETIALEVAALTLTSESPLPNLSAAGSARFGERMQLQLQGELPQWPAGWPALPEPLSASASPLAYVLAYAGPLDFGAPLSLQLVRDETRLDSTLALPAMLAWLDQDNASLLPPLQGRLETPRLVVNGVTLEGVRVIVEEDAPSATGPLP